MPPLRFVGPVKAAKLLGVTAILFPPVPLSAPVARAVIVRLLVVFAFDVAVRTASVVVLLPAPLKTLAIVEARAD